MSTLVRRINCLIESTSGDILINGTDVGNVAFAFELRNVDAFTRANVANETIEPVSFQGYRDRMPAASSGGMQQQVGPAQVNDWILKIGRDKMDPRDVAEEWVAENMNTVNVWIN